MVFRNARENVRIPVTSKVFSMEDVQGHRLCRWEVVLWDFVSGSS